jgi:hypothetical protein
MLWTLLVGESKKKKKNPKDNITLGLLGPLTEYKTDIKWSSVQNNRCFIQTAVCSYFLERADTENRGEHFITYLDTLI